MEGDYVKKVLVIIAVIAYDLSPIDLFPGPIDDAIVTILGFLWTHVMATKAIGTSGTDAAETHTGSLPASTALKHANTKSIHKTDAPEKM